MFSNFFFKCISIIIAAWEHCVAYSKRTWQRFPLTDEFLMHQKLIVWCIRQWLHITYSFECMIWSAERRFSERPNDILRKTRRQWSNISGTFPRKCVIQKSWDCLMTFSNNQNVTLAVFSGQLLVFCLQTPLSELRMIGIFTSKLIFHWRNLSRAAWRVNQFE